MPASAGRVSRFMSPCSRSEGVSAISTAIVCSRSPCERTACAAGVSEPPPPPQPARTSNPAVNSALDEGPSLEAEQKLLALEAARVPNEASARADDPVARHDDRHGVPVERAADGTGRLRLPDARGEAAVGVDLAVRDPLQLGEDALLEGGEHGQIDREVEVVAPALEVFVELATGFLHGPWRAKHAHAVEPGEALHLGLGVRIEGDLAEAALGRGDEESADRGIGQVVGDVEQILGSCPV